MTRVRIEVLGELRVLGSDRRVIDLPASRKTKALLAYLALTGRPQLREHLCDLLWDGADDPRGALRWSLSRLRAGLDTATTPCIEADRRSVALIPGAFSLDLHEAEQAVAVAGGPPSIDALREAEALYRGGLLEGLDLLDAFRFHSWCVGRREVARSLRLKILEALIGQAPQAEEALKYAHALVSIDPLNEAAHTQVIRLLLEMQRHTDAQAQADSYRRTLEIELGEVPPEVAERLRKIVYSDAPAPRAAPGLRKRAPAVDALPLVGRVDEVATLTKWFAASSGAPTLAVISGEPGAGKTRLMNDVIASLGAGTHVIRGRAYRAENARAFGPWRDALADVLRAGAALTAVTDNAAEPQKRTQLFEELVALVTAQGASAGRLVIALDDLQWLDEASVAFAHFLVRARPANVKFIGTVRTAEVVDNLPLGEALDSLRKSDMLEVRARPLSRDEVAQICALVGEHVDLDEVFHRSKGNPFLATEIARAFARGEKTLPADMRHLVEARLRTLSDPARELLPWAAALGRTFHVDVLERVTRLDPVELVERVRELEERGVFEPRQTGAYDFVHDLVRDAAYGELSAPRQRIVHRSIARSLESWDGAGVAYSAAELLRHAELGGEAAIACKAAAAAAQDALDVCAWVDACIAADRGLQHTSAVASDSRVAATLSLLSCRITAGSILARHHPDHVVSAVDEAVKLSGTPQQQAHALYLQALLRFDHGQTDRAQRGLVEMANAGRKADPETAARQIAHSARCMLHIEGPVTMARSMVGEAREALGSMGLEDVELFWAEALLARWDGDLDRARAQLEEAIRLATETGRGWRRSSCLTHLIMISSEAGDPDRVESLSRGGLEPGEQGVDPLKSPFVEGLAGLADLQRDPSSTDRLDRANEVLRARGANTQLAYLLAESARLHADAGNLHAASDAAREAVRLGELVNRVVSQTDALVTLASVALQRGDKAAAVGALAKAQRLAISSDVVTARVWRRLRRIAAGVQPD